MIPQNRLSTWRMVAPFSGARAMPRLSLLEDREDGGVGLSDSSQGLLVKTWEATCDGADITLRADGVSPTVVHSDADITEISFTFNQNMQPVLAWVAGGITKLRYYDVGTSNFITTAFGATYQSPRVSLDDKHRLASDTNDVIFAYVRAGGLYYRQQRENYATERLLMSGLAAGTRLWRMGMSVENRLQFELGSEVVAP